MTEKQQQILDQVQELLIEHFDAHVVVTDISDVDDSNNHSTQGGYSGGIPIAMGLCLYQIEYLKRKTFDAED
jgi:hypothetical protein